MKPAPVPARCLPARKIRGIASAPRRAGNTRYESSASSPIWRATPALSHVIGRARRYGMPEGMTAPCPSASALAANDVVSSSPKNPRSPRPVNRIHPPIRVITISRTQIADCSRFPVMQTNLRGIPRHTPELMSVRLPWQHGPGAQMRRTDQADFASSLRQLNAALTIKVHAMHTQGQSAESPGSGWYRVRPAAEARAYHGALLARAGAV